VGSVPSPKPGDWLEHEAFSRPSYRGTRKIAEVADASSTIISLYLQGEPGFHPLPRAEITRWWNPFEPKAEPDDIEAPAWLQQGMEFDVEPHAFGNRGDGAHRAVICTARGAWVSYVEDCVDYSNVFRLMPFREFTKLGWKARRAPSVWDWLRKPMV
jgi:hypothetical protein